MSWQNPNHEATISLWEGEPGACAPPGADEIGQFRSLHIPRVGDLIPMGPGLWRVLAVQWTIIPTPESANYRDGQRGPSIDLAVERADGIFTS